MTEDQYDTARDDSPPLGVKKGGGPRTAAGVRRRLEAIGALEDPRKSRRKRNALATSLIRQIAAGNVKNPTAVAQAFVEGLPGTSSEPSREVAEAG